ncbi:FAD-binding oxidoreductase [Sporomusa acidovorans]|uniref:D-lactate dehydrogenase (cytochrome) n=1 Tax=Sporomusa acidovorans (strain ATCC 49682 / DSM 3132 / Mol) TaxID=1123286 RepID=A0ABZ3J549_SPOA4|nr:FAD-binding oxidoreductase [Sporomusa acidovorans]OZC15644.1 putative FAD-linked oxidoreductase [Sporomusa acidovorans DSM 3132]SDE88082.1 glycolate oxidase [Sporomusa acidovorans]
MDAQTVEQVKSIFGNRATTDDFERSFYERDLAPIPDFLVKPLAHTLPDIVVRPQTTEEVACLVKLAKEQKVAVTTRAGGSTVYFNAVCTQNGIILDINGVNGLTAVDAENRVVRVGAGMTWWELERRLEPFGLATCSYPSSAQAATIGGWLVMMGYGIGSLQYGPVMDQVVAAQVVLPDGSNKKLDKTSKPPLTWFAASEGTLGIVMEVELKVRSKPETEWHNVAVFENAGQMQTFIEEAVELKNKPFNLHFSDPGCNSRRQRLGLAGSQSGEAYTVAFDADGSAEETQTARLAFKRCLQAAKGGELGETEGNQEWRHRFYSLVLKREGPSLLGAEICLPILKLADYLAAVAAFGDKQKLKINSYGHIISPQYAMIMTMFNADERDTVGYLQGLALVKKLHDIGARHGGVPYGIGLWNTPYLSRCQTNQELAELKRRKQLLDPHNIMNPGKRYEAPLLLKPPLFAVGMDVLAATRWVYRGGRNQP